MKRMFASLVSIVSLLTLFAAPVEAAYTSRGYANRVSAGRPSIRQLKRDTLSSYWNRATLSFRRSLYSARIGHLLGSIPSRLAVTGMNDRTATDYVIINRPSRRMTKSAAYRLPSHCDDEAKFHGRTRYNNNRRVSRCEQEFE